MAEDKEKIVIQFDTNADKASKDVDKLTTSITQTEEVTKKGTKANKELKDSTDKAAESSKSQKEALDLVGGGFGTAIEGAKGLIKQFFLLLANPIIAGLAAIVAVTTLVFKAFTSTKAGGEALDRVFAAIGATVDVFRDRFLQLVNGIASLNLKEVINSFSGLGDEITKESIIALKFTKQLQEIVDSERELSVSRSKLNRDLAVAKELVSDENATYAQKKKAINEIRIAEEKQTKSEIITAKRRLEASKVLNNQSDSDLVALQKEADARKALFDLQTQSSATRRLTNRQDKQADRQERARLKGINDEEKARLKTFNDAANAAAKERKANSEKESKEKEAREKEAKQKAEDLAKEQFKVDEESLNQIKEKDKLAQEENIKKLEQDGKDRLAVFENEANEKAKIDAAALQQEETLQSLRGQIAEKGLNLLKSVFGKSKIVQKAVMIAEGALSIGKMIASNNVANAGALATPQAILTSGASALPVIALNNISTGIGVASTIAATAKALSSVGGGSVSGTSPASGARGASGAASAAPQTGFQPSATNQLATSISANTNAQPIIKAYVVAQDVTDQQKKDTDLVSQNSFGGVIT
jgi:hypothetical protein